MKGGVAILVTFLVCLVVVALYWFLGKSQMNKTLGQQRAEIVILEDQLEEIRKKEQEISELTRQLPVWLKQTMLFKSAIPETVDDHMFFSYLADELKKYPEVSLLSIESNFGGPWLGEIKEQEREELTSLGIDPDVAAGIRVVFYSIKLNGDFDEILNVFENLKKSQRLYTIDLIAGPAAGGSGTISVNNQPEFTPMQFSGRLYYNLQDPALSIEGLEEMYFNALASRIHRQMVESGADAIDESRTGPAAAGSPEAEGAPGGDSAGEEQGSSAAGPGDDWQAISSGADPDELVSAVVTNSKEGRQDG